MYQYLDDIVMIATFKENRYASHTVRVGALPPTSYAKSGTDRVRVMTCGSDSGSGTVEIHGSRAVKLQDLSLIFNRKSLKKFEISDFETDLSPREKNIF